MKWLIVVVCAFTILGLFLGAERHYYDNLENDATSLEQSSSNGAIASKPEETKTYELGDAIAAGDFTWTIQDMSLSKQIGSDIAGAFYGQEADGIYLIVDVEVENTDNSAQYLSDSFLTLIDDQGREFSPDTNAAFYLDSKSALGADLINPGVTKKGRIVYDVPEDMTLADVKISSNLMTNSFYQVKLVI